MANPTLVELFQDIADEIREKRKDLETTDLLVAANFPEEIRKIVTDPSGISTATASDILYEKTACISGDGSITTGTMPNNGAVSKVLTTQNSYYTIPKGYHDGTGKVTATLTDAVLTSSVSLSSSSVSSSLTSTTSTFSNIVNAAKSVGTTTTPTSGVYVKVVHKPATALVSATPSAGVSTEGYVSTSSSNTGTAKSITIKAASDLYIPIITSSATTPAITITKDPSLTLSSGSIKASYTGGQNVTPIVPNAGWVASGTAGYVTTTGTKTLALTEDDLVTLAGEASVKSGTGSISIKAPSYNSANANFDVTASATISAPSVESEGYISDNKGTKTSNSASGATTLDKITIKATGGSGSTNSSITRIAKGTDDIWVDAASGSATLTVPTAAVPYVKVQADKKTVSITPSASVTKAGYGTTDYFTPADAIAGTATVNASTYYVPVTTGTITPGSLSLTNATGSGSLTVPSQSGSSYVFKASATLTAPKVSKAGWLNTQTITSGNNDSITFTMPTAVISNYGSTAAKVSATLTPASKASSSTETWVDAYNSSGTITTTAPTDKTPYIKISAGGTQTDGTGYYYVRTAGYTPTTSNKSISVSASVTNITKYIPIKTSTVTLPSSLSKDPTITSHKIDASTGTVTANFSNSGTVAVTTSMSAPGWVASAPSGNVSISGTGTSTLELGIASVTVNPVAGTIKPTLNRGTKGSSETWTDASDTTSTYTTAPSDGVYVKVYSTANSSVTAGEANYTNTVGYITAHTSGQGHKSVTTNLQSAYIYVPVATATVSNSCTITGDTVALNTTISKNSSNGISVPVKATGTGTVAISLSKSTGGWVKSVTGGSASATITGSVNLTTSQLQGIESGLAAGNIRSGYSIFGVSGTFTSDATAAATQILTGEIAYVKGSSVTGTMPDKTGWSSSLSYTSQSITIPKGYHDGTKTVTASYPSSSISGGALTLTVASSTTNPYTTAPSWNSTSSKWEYSVSASRGAVSNASAGWTTKSTVIDTNSTSSTIQIPKIGISVVGGTNTLTPNFTVGTLGSSETWINAANGTSYTTSATASTPYVKLTVSADTKYISITPSVTTAGYGGTGGGEYTISTNTSGTAKFQSSTIYVPIKTTSPSATKITTQNGSVTIDPGYITSKTTITATFPTSTAKVTADSFTITPSITYDSSTGKISATGNSSKTITPSVSQNGYITTSSVSGAAISASLSGGSVTPASILPSSTVPSSLTITAQNGTLTIGAGWLASSQTIKATITSGSVSATSSLTFAGKTTASTITPTWTVNSGGTAYTSSLSAAISKTTLSAGYFTTQDIVSAKTITHTLSIAAAKISTSGANISITPSIASNISSISGCTNAAASATLVSSVTSGNVYVPVTVSGSNNGNASYSATAGYLSTTSTTNISSSASIASTTRYVQINKSNVTAYTITSQNGTYSVPVGYVTSATKITATINNATITTPTSSITTGNITKSTPTKDSNGTITIPINASGTTGTVSISVSEPGYVSSITGGAAKASFAGSVSLTKTELQTLEPNLTGNNILSGTSIFGVNGTITGILDKTNTFTHKNYFSWGSVVGSSSTEGTITIGSSGCPAGLVAHSGIKGEKVYNAVWNDLADLIPVDKDCELEFGKCYCFDGEKYYKSTKYLDDGIIGIHSDVAGFEMGHKDNVKEIKCSVAGFVLAYVDREYPVGTLLTCTEEGYLTEIKKEDKINYPEKIVGSYWKDEKEEYWGSEQHKVLVNGRKWIKVR